MKNVIARPARPDQPTSPQHHAEPANPSEALVATCAAGAADPVDVGHHCLREIVVDDRLDVLQVDPSREHLRANQRPELAQPHPTHCELTSLLRQPRVDRIRLQHAR